jgi:hypothetical protein
VVNFWERRGIAKRCHTERHTPDTFSGTVTSRKRSTFVTKEIHNSHLFRQLVWDVISLYEYQTTIIVRWTWLMKIHVHWCQISRRTGKGLLHTWLCKVKIFTLSVTSRCKVKRSKIMVTESNLAIGCYNILRIESFRTNNIALQRPVCTLLIFNFYSPSYMQNKKKFNYFSHHLWTKGKHLNTLEKYHIYKISKDRLHMYDTYIDKNKPIFETLQELDSR